MYYRLLFSLLILFIQPATATDLYESLEPESADSSLWLEYNIGLENSKNYYAELDLAIVADHHLLLGGGKSDVLTLTDRVDLYTLTLGYNSPYGAPFEYGLIYDFWGNTDELWTNTLSVPLRWNTQNWSLSLRPQFMRIFLYTQRRFNRTRRLHSSDSRALSGEVTYYGFERWELGVSASAYSYEADLSKLDSPIAPFLFSDITLVLSYGFPSSRLAASLAYNFDNWRLGIRQEQTISAVDDSRLDITSLSSNFYLSNDFSLLLEAGYIGIENSQPYNYYKLGTQIFF